MFVSRVDIIELSNSLEEEIAQTILTDTNALQTIFMSVERAFMTS